jgi:3-hydroxyisobutyrate dehydrogenase
MKREAREKMAKQVGFIGLGLMGGNMAHRLTECGISVLAFELRKEVAEGFKDLVTLAGSVAEVAANCDIICSSLPHSKAVTDVYLGEDGVLKNAKAGAVCIDLSSVDPQTIKRCYEAGKKAGIGFVDSPVSGGPTNCYDGTLTLIIGGDDEDVAKGDAVFQALGGKGVIHRAGPSGAGVTVKLVNNAIAISNMVTTTEGFMLGVKAGVDPDLLYQILNTSGARSYHLNKRIPWVLDGSVAEPRFKLETARKDVGLALDMAHQIGMPLPVIANAYELLNVGMSQGWGEEDCVAIVKFYEQLAGVTGRSRKKPD